MIYIITLIILSYAILIIAFIIGFNKVKSFNNNSKNTINSFSIIIPFRDEVNSLPELLESLIKLKYPIDLFEIIFVNDESRDDSVKVINNILSNSEINFKIISNRRKSNSPKKDAIESAILQSKFEWIVTTDADCIIPKKWLKSFDKFIPKENPKMICAPVTYKTNESIFHKFQLLDFISLIGSTIGGFGIKKPFMCNGANLCYSKKAFKDVNGFDGNNQISSGDDIFLLEKMTTKFPNDVFFLKSREALIYTKPESSFNELIFQRIRWASKSKYYKNLFGKIVGVLVLLTNFSLTLLIIFSLLKVILWKFTFLFFSIKFIVDLTLIIKTLIFTKQTKNIVFYPIIAVYHPFFIVFVTFLSVFNKSFKWKKRIIKI